MTVPTSYLQIALTGFYPHLSSEVDQIKMDSNAIRRLLTVATASKVGHGDFLLMAAAKQSMEVYSSMDMAARTSFLRMLAYEFGRGFLFFHTRYFTA